MKKLKKAGIIVVSFFLLYTVFGFLIFPATVKYFAANKLTEALSRTTSIEKISINPYSLAVTVKGLAVNKRDNPEKLVSLDELFVDAQWMSIFKWAVIVREFRLTGPHINIDRLNQQEFNFSDLIPRGAAGRQGEQEEPSKPLQFSINNIQVINGTMHLSDHHMDTKHQITAINLTIPFVSNQTYSVELFVQPSFSARFNETPVVLQGRTKPFADSLETLVDINLKNIYLPKYFAYIPFETGIRLPSGSLDVTAFLSYAVADKDRPSVKINGTVTLRDFAVTDKKKNPLFSLDGMRLEIARSDILAGDIHLALVRFQAPEVDLIRKENKEINIYSVGPADTGGPQAPSRQENEQPFKITVDEVSIGNFGTYLSDRSVQEPPEGITPAREPLFLMDNLTIRDTEVNSKDRTITVGTIATDNGTLTVRPLKNGTLNLLALVPDPPQKKEEPPAEKAPVEGTPWLVDLKNFRLTRYSLDAQRIIPADGADVRIDLITLGASNFSTQPKSRMGLDVTCRINDKGDLSARGSVGISPVAGDLKLTAGNLNLSWLQPYIENVVKVIIPRGTFSTDAAVTFSLSPAGEPRATFKGNSAISDLEVLHKKDGKKLLTWKNLYVGAIDAGYNPLYATIEKIKLVDLFSQLIINSDGTLNLETIAAADKPADTPRQEPSSSLSVPVTINSVELQNGNLVFTDRSVDPAYSTTLAALYATVTGLSTQETRRADVTLKGKLDKQAPLAITGTIHPVVSDLFVDLKVMFNDIDLSAFSPYAGKYVGYGISKGKLNLDLAYLINKNELDSKNDVFLDQFTFGRKVESPDAVSLPVKLGVALLKDRNGEIKLNLPVTGRLDDPEFSITKIIFQIIKNLLVKAAASPFKLMGSLFGGGEELSHLEFDYGKTDISEENAKKLESLVQALYNRPGLDLEIKGYVSTAEDRTSLIEYTLSKTVKSKKLKHMLKKGREAVPVDDIVLEPDEYKKFLWKAYKEAKFEKPKNMIGMVKKLPPEAMEQAIRDNIQIADADLRILARKRAQKVKESIVASGKVEPERLFIVEPESLEPEKIENFKNSRVELSLQ